MFIFHFNIIRASNHVVIKYKKILIDKIYEILELFLYLKTKDCYINLIYKKYLKLKALDFSMKLNKAGTRKKQF